MDLLPGWNSIEATARLQHVFVKSSLVLLALLVLAMGLAYLYGHRRDTLSDESSRPAARPDRPFMEKSDTATAQLREPARVVNPPEAPLVAKPPPRTEQNPGSAASGQIGAGPKPPRDVRTDTPATKVAPAIEPTPLPAKAATEPMPLSANAAPEPTPAPVKPAAEQTMKSAKPATEQTQPATEPTAMPAKPAPRNDANLTRDLDLNPAKAPAASAAPTPRQPEPKRAPQPPATQTPATQAAPTQTPATNPDALRNTNGARHLTADQRSRLHDFLKNEPKGRLTIRVNPAVPDASNYGVEIARFFKHESGWTVRIDNSPFMGKDLGGMWIALRSEDAIPPATGALHAALAHAHVPVHPQPQWGNGGPAFNEIWLVIGKRN